MKAKKRKKHLLPLGMIPVLNEYQALGWVVHVYPYLGCMSLNGGRRKTYEQACKLMKSAIESQKVTHSLVIESLHDARLSCSCGRWSLITPGRLTREEAEHRHNSHKERVSLLEKCM